MNVFVARCILNENCELITPQTSHDVARPNLMFHAKRGLLQVPIADLVAVLIVDELESIEIDVDQAEAGLFGFRLLDDLSKAIL